MHEPFVIGDETTHMPPRGSWPLTRGDRCGRPEEELD